MSWLEKLFGLRTNEDTEPPPCSPADMTRRDSQPWRQYSTEHLQKLVHSAFPDFAPHLDEWIKIHGLTNTQANFLGQLAEMALLRRLKQQVSAPMENDYDERT